MAKPNEPKKNSLHREDGGGGLCHLNSVKSGGFYSKDHFARDGKAYVLHDSLPNFGFA